MANMKAAVIDTIDILFNEPSVFEPVTVQPPPKRDLASMRIELSEEDFKRRLPKPVISLESHEVTSYEGNSKNA